MTVVQKSARKVEKNDKDSQDEKATTGKANTPAVGTFYVITIGISVPKLEQLMFQLYIAIIW
ncbi:unnamed protein product [Camellia sinensis]